MLAKCYSVPVYNRSVRNVPLCPRRRTKTSIAQLTEQLQHYKESPRSVIQKRLVENGISPENARKYADLLEEKGLDTNQKADALVKRMKTGKYPKL